MKHPAAAGILILLFFLLRLYGITNPPLERNHNWRQVTTNMYARNFLEVDNNPLYCRVDMAGDLTGITAKEFPLYNYLIYLAAEAFGWQHWYGRLISLLVSSLGVWFFYLLLKKYLDAPQSSIVNRNSSIALPATVILLCSIWFGHSRIIMPDTFSVSLVLVGLYFGLGYLYEGRRSWLLWFGLFGTLGALSKLPSGFLLAVLLIPVFQQKVPFPRKIWLSVAGAVLLGACGWWYFRWLPQVVATYGYEHYPMRSLLTGMQEIFNDLPETFERFYQSALKSYVAFALYLAGVVLAFWRRNRLLTAIFSVLSLFFLGYLFKSGETFYVHNYYIIPFVPVMSLFAAFAWAQVPQQWLRNLLLLAIAAEGIANQQHEFRIPLAELPKLELESIADSLGQRSDRIVFHSETANPQELYFTHRKGWLADAAHLNTPTYLNEIRRRGCRLLFVNKKSWGNQPLPTETLVFENENYLVFRL